MAAVMTIKWPTTLSPTNACAILLAAGTGTRARETGQPDSAAKQFMNLLGKPLLAWSLESLSSHPNISTVVLVLPDGEDQTALWREHVSDHVDLLTTIGGASRRESTLAGLEAWASSSAFDRDARILIHDGARPFASHDLIDRLLDGLQRAPCAIPRLAVTDTLKASDGAVLTSGPDRSTLVTVQTPQAFHGETIIKAHRAVKADQPDISFTDDASIAEWAGQRCIAVQGDIDNIKITTPDDWARAKAILKQREGRMLEPRTGIGYDVHRLVPGEGVWLCGHFIAHTLRLDGHSDADVGLHALTDALLGAIGEGDIGTHFPPSDPQWKGAASHQFLTHAAELVRARQGKIVNVDVAIVAEQPKIGPHRSAMVAVMAETLQIAPNRVSVKATTNERMGFTGREEGIAALATVSVLVPDPDSNDD
jgi:2-C-methyl-D-erythritol 4-phosphate cytidylyltransferase/2-C-methyl-D-erythritol 2,4-cyclodiphosphate synthase